MIDWLPGVLRDPFPAGENSFIGVPWRIVVHTTEGTSYAAARAVYSSGAYAPHFTISFEGGQVIVRQHHPLTRSAAALVHPAGAVDTNRANAIQIEVVGTCDPRNQWGAWRTDSFPDAYRQGIAALLSELCDLLGVPRTYPPAEPYPASYGAQGVRMTPQEWLAYSGVCSHQHVPGNVHGDCGDLDVQNLLGAPPAPTDLEGLVALMPLTDVWKSGDAATLRRLAALLLAAGAWIDPLTATPVSPPGRPIDAAWRQIVDAGLRWFQGAHGLAVDGVAGPQTWRALLAG